MEHDFKNIISFESNINYFLKFNLKAALFYGKMEEGKHEREIEMEESYTVEMHMLLKCGSCYHLVPKKSCSKESFADSTTKMR